MSGTLLNTTKAPVRHVPRGVTIFAEGGSPQRLRLLEGWAAVERNGRAAMLRLNGEHLAPFDGPPPYSVRALTPIVVADENWEAKDVVEFLRRSLRQTVRVSAMSSLARTADFLIDLAQRIPVDTDGAFHMPLGQAFLAELLGMSPVHVNRILQVLRRKGLLRTKKCFWRLPDMDGLRNLVDSHTTDGEVGHFERGNGAITKGGPLSVTA